MAARGSTDLRNSSISSDGVDRTAPPPSTHSDEYLNHWADVYVERQVREYGVHLEYFLIAPVDILRWIDLGRLKPMTVLANQALLDTRGAAEKRLQHTRHAYMARRFHQPS